MTNHEERLSCSYWPMRRIFSPDWPPIKLVLCWNFWGGNCRKISMWTLLKAVLEKTFEKTFFVVITFWKNWNSGKSQGTVWDVEKSGNFEKNWKSRKFFFNSMVLKYSRYNFCCQTQNYFQTCSLWESLKTGREKPGKISEFYSWKEVATVSFGREKMFILMTEHVLRVCLT